MDVDVTEPDMDVDAAGPQEAFSASDFNRAVGEAITQRKLLTSGRTPFPSPTVLSWTDASELLCILMTVRLGSNSMGVSDCTTYLYSHDALGEDLQDAYANGSFESFLANPRMPADFLAGTSHNPAGIASSDSNNSLKSAFEAPYEGTVYQVFIDTLNRERAFYSNQSSPNSAYNWTISVIQSSGTGKSRMVEQAANKVFTIPINLHEDLNDGRGNIKTFPPPDDALRLYFESRANKTDDQQKADYAVLLRVLFDTTREMVQALWPDEKGAALAERWADYMRQGLTGEENGKNRRNLYSSVVQKTQRLREERYSNKTLADLQRPLFKSCYDLVAAVHPDRVPRTNALFVYFDEAHPLTKVGTSTDGTPNHSAFRNLGTVLAALREQPAFFIFLSTDSRLKDYAPAVRHQPSLLVVQGGQLIPPFNELPFDLYEDRVLEEVDSVTLANVCKKEVMAGFGRPLWYAQHKAYPERDLLTFAVDKLTGTGTVTKERERDAQIAALGVRIGMTFDAMLTATLALQSRLTESHMRVVYSIPRHQNHMHTGSPSEPVLAEAAGLYFEMDNRWGLPIEGPKILASECDGWPFSRGERGELCGRLLATSAHDLAVKEFYYVQPPKGSPRHHRPVPLLHWIRALFGRSHHEAILKATPVASENGPTLEQAFSASYISFSHFALADDDKMLSEFGLATALVRGMALQAKENQVSIDAVIPIHMAAPATPISPATTSAINLQFKNRKQASDCHVDHTITVSDTTKATISIVFELGARNQPPGVCIRHQNHTKTRGTEDKVHPNDHHYLIVAYGCDSEVFSAIPPEAEPDYKTILRGGSMEEDFPRKKMEDNLAMLHQINPSFNGVRQRKRYSNVFGLDGEVL
ncbi:hypothetical protein K438DRAFT_2014426 [Mycena galopus ATCC 62051]|nr:hypothetical protein K438DRAFT_2014426 [Mycena galopus ATCC 62051]